MDVADALVGLVFLTDSKRVKLIHKDAIVTVEDDVPDHSIYPGDWIIFKKTAERLTFIAKVDARLPTRTFSNGPYGWHTVQVQTVAVRPKIHLNAQYKDCVWSPHFGYILDPRRIFWNVRFVDWDVAYSIWCTLNNEPSEPGMYRPLMAVVEIDCLAADQMLALFAPWLLEDSTTSESPPMLHQAQTEVDCQDDLPQPDSAVLSVSQSVSASGIACNSEDACVELLTAFSILYGLLKERFYLIRDHSSNAFKMDKKLAKGECEAEAIAQLSMHQQSLEEEQRNLLREKFLCCLEKLIIGCDATGVSLPSRSRKDVKVLLDSQLRPQTRAHYRWHLSACGNDGRKKFIAEALSKNEQYFDENVSAWHCAVRILDQSIDEMSSTQVINLMKEMVKQERKYYDHKGSKPNTVLKSIQQQEKVEEAEAVHSEVKTELGKVVGTQRSSTSEISGKKPPSDASEAPLSKIIIQLLTTRRSLFLKHHTEANKALKRNRKGDTEVLSKRQRNAEVLQFKKQSEILETLKCRGDIADSASIGRQVKKEARKILNVIEPCARAQLKFHLKYYVCENDDKLSTATFRHEVSRILKLPKKEFLASEILSSIGLDIILPKGNDGMEQNRLQESICCDRQENDEKAEDKKTVDSSDKRTEPEKSQASPVDLLTKQLKERRSLFQRHRQEANEVLLRKSKSAARELSSNQRALERKQWKEQSVALSKFTYIQDFEKLSSITATKILNLVKEVCDLARAQGRFHRVYLPQGKGENTSEAVEKELASNGLLLTKLVVTSDVGLKILRSACGFRGDNDLELILGRHPGNAEKMDDEEPSKSSDKADKAKSFDKSSEQTESQMSPIDFLEKQLKDRRDLFICHRQEANEVLRQNDENAAKALSLKQRTLEQKQLFVQRSALSASFSHLEDVQKLPPAATRKMLSLLKQVLDVARAQNRFHKLYLAQGEDKNTSAAVERELASDNLLFALLVVTSEIGIRILRKACGIQNDTELFGEQPDLKGTTKRSRGGAVVTERREKPLASEAACCPNSVSSANVSIAKDDVSTVLVSRTTPLPSVTQISQENNHKEIAFSDSNTQKEEQNSPLCKQEITGDAQFAATLLNLMEMHKKLLESHYFAAQEARNCGFPERYELSLKQRKEENQSVEVLRRTFLDFACVGTNLINASKVSPHFMKTLNELAAKVHVFRRKLLEFHVSTRMEHCANKEYSLCHGDLHFRHFIMNSKRFDFICLPVWTQTSLDVESDQKNWLSVLREEVVSCGEIAWLDSAMKDFDEFFDCWNLSNGTANWILDDRRDVENSAKGCGTHMMPMNCCTYHEICGKINHQKCVNAVERIGALSPARRSVCLSADNGLLQRRFQFLLCTRRRSRLEIWTAKTPPNAKEAVATVKDVFESDPTAFNVTVVFPKLYFDLFCTDYAFCDMRPNETRSTAVPGSKRAMLINALHEIINADKMGSVNVAEVSDTLSRTYMQIVNECKHLMEMENTDDKDKHVGGHQDKLCSELLPSEKNKQSTKFARS